MSDDEETLAIIDDFQELTLNENFRDKLKNNSSINNKMINLAKKILKAAGTTEYTTIDGGYTGDELLEKHKIDRAGKWNGKKGKTQSYKRNYQ